MSRSHWMLLAVVGGLALVWWVATLDPGAEPEDPDAELAAAPIPSEARVAPPAAANTAASASAKPPTETPAAAKNEAIAEPSAEPQASPEVEIPVPARSGPVEELQRAFEHEPRASSGARFEAAIEEQFRRPEVRAGLLKSVICRTTVCRIETRWSPEHAEGFMSALMHLVADPSGAETIFDSQLGISPEANVGPDGSWSIEVYLKLAAPSAPAAR